VKTIKVLWNNLELRSELFVKQITLSLIPEIRCFNGSNTPVPQLASLRIASKSIKVKLGSDCSSVRYLALHAIHGLLRGLLGVPRASHGSLRVPRCPPHISLGSLRARYLSLRALPGLLHAALSAVLVTDCSVLNSWRLHRSWITPCSTLDSIAPSSDCSLLFT